MNESTRKLIAASRRAHDELDNLCRQERHWWLESVAEELAEAIRAANHGSLDLDEPTRAGELRQAAREADPGAAMELRRAAEKAARDRVREARGHLATALVQAIPSDDQIIIGHVRAAHDLLKERI